MSTVVVFVADIAAAAADIVDDVDFPFDFVVSDFVLDVVVVVVVVVEAR